MNILKKTNISKLQKLGLTDTADKINEMVEFLNELPQEVDSDWLPDRHINLSAGQGDGFHEPHVVNRVIFKDEPKCVCGQQYCLGGAEVEIGGVCHSPHNPCYIIDFKDEEQGWVKEFKDESWANNFDKAFPCESEMCKTGCICGMDEIKDFIYETIIGERRIAYQKGKEDYCNSQAAFENGDSTRVS